MLTTSILIGICITAAVFFAGAALLFRGDESTAVEGRLEALTGTGKGAKKGKGDQPSLLTEALGKGPGALESLFSRIGNVRVFLEQAGSQMEPSKFLMLCGLFAAGGAAACFVSKATMLGAPVAAVMTGSLPLLWMIFKRKRRLAAFAKQLPEALELMSRALRAGHSLGAGFSLVADEMQEPLRREFQRCYEEQNFGVSLENALLAMAERVPNLDLRFFATAVILQRQTGGDLAEILDKIGYLIRERFKIWGQVQALTGEGRLSGIVLLALPPVLFIVMLRISYSYVMMLFEDPMGQQMLAGAIVMQLLGALVIRKIVNIKV
jgi:tight adherence protein B